MLDHPIVRIVLVAAAVILVIWLVMRRRTTTPGKPEVDGEIEKLVLKQRFGEAARLAIDRELFGQAIELYLRAQQPANAANIAARIGDLRHAAELYERAGNLERAAHYYDKAGIGPKAEEIRKKLQVKPPPGKVSVPEVSGGRGLEAEWRRLATLSDGSEAQRAELQRSARGAADALLSEGELARAADLYRDASLDDEAIHLYVNVLGDPGQAAPIVARRGNHQRAAELYELAGQRERAAMSWVQVARSSPRPDQFFERIEDLSPPVAVGYFEKEVASQKLSAGTVALYYFLARALAAAGKIDRARDTYHEIVAAIGDYKDVKNRIASLVGGGSPLVEEPLDLDDAPAPSQPRATPSPLSAEELEQLAIQVATAAAAHLKLKNDLASVMASSSSPVVARVSRTEFQIAGLEIQPLKVELLYDDAVAAARVGPSIDTLNRFISGPCDLQNIEVYFRVGLAHLAAGDWERALEAFDAVEDASPGYRDAWKRADEIRAWRGAFGGRGTKLGDAALVGGAKGASRYELRGELGRGGMAVVYRAFDSVLGREVALKFLSEELSSQDEMREMFQREARAVAALNHPNIVTIHDVGFLEERAFICMEFVDGRSVESLVSESPGLTIIEALRVIKQALDALAYAHQRKIIHRDIKPANMMRTSSGLLKLMDFGLAKSTLDRKKTSYIAGTPGYMAPEHLRGEELDARADLFAIAVSLYEMLSGALPYEGLDRSTPAVPLEERVPAVPPTLAAAVMRGLALDRNKRWPSAGEFAAPLAQILEAVSRFGHGGATEPVVPPAGALDLGNQATAILNPARSDVRTMPIDPKNLPRSPS